LAPVEPTGINTLIGFAAKAGSIALDGEGANSPYATAVLNHLATPGLDLRIGFGRVRDEVLKVTRNKQEPFVYGSLGGNEIALVPANAPQTAPISAPKPSIDYDKEMELVFWNAVKDAKSRGLLQTYLGRYPAGNFAGLAKVLIEQLDKEQDATRLAAERDTQAQLAEAARLAAEAKRIEELRKADALRRKEEEQRTEELKRAQADARAEAQRAQDVARKAEAERIAALKEADAARRDAEAARAEQQRLAKLAADGGTVPKPATIAGLPTGVPSGSPATVELEDPATLQAKLARALQTELKRVGCDPGAIDGNWGPKAKDALAEFARRAKIELKSDAPTEDLLLKLSGRREPVCPSSLQDKPPKSDAKSRDVSRQKVGKQVRDGLPSKNDAPRQTQKKCHWGGVTPSFAVTCD
jgi:caspase domain-containing protein